MNNLMLSIFWLNLISTVIVSYVIIIIIIFYLIDFCNYTFSIWILTRIKNYEEKEFYKEFILIEFLE